MFNNTKIYIIIVVVLFKIDSCTASWWIKDSKVISLLLPSLRSVTTRAGGSGDQK